MGAIISNLKRDLRKLLREGKRAKGYYYPSHIIIFTEEETAEPEATMLFEDQIDMAFNFLVSRDAYDITVIELGRNVLTYEKVD